jgi:hypothetical protein
MQAAPEMLDVPRDLLAPADAPHRRHEADGDVRIDHRTTLSGSVGPVVATVRGAAAKALLAKAEKAEKQRTELQERAEGAELATRRPQVEADTFRMSNAEGLLSEVVPDALARTKRVEDAVKELGEALGEWHALDHRVAALIEDVPGYNPAKPAVVRPDGSGGQGPSAIHRADPAAAAAQRGGGDLHPAGARPRPGDPRCGPGGHANRRGVIAVGPPDVLTAAGAYLQAVGGSLERR